MNNDKIKHSRRIKQTQTYIARQVMLANTIHKQPIDTPHKYHKLSADTCGNPNCFMCGNPRKYFSELTIQEQSMFQQNLHTLD